MNVQYNPTSAENDRPQPTDPHLVWGSRRDRDKKFLSRSIIVEHLISCWTKPDWSAVDVTGGAGRWLSTLAPRFRHFTHLDLSPDALNLARDDHPEFPDVEFGKVDLLRPTSQGGHLSCRTWDAIFCLDTLLYRGDFVETVLRNIRTLVRPGGVIIIDVPLRFRASISRWVKGQRYGGPERTFSPSAALQLANDAGYACIATAYQYRELAPSTYHILVERELTGWLPWPGTWMYLVLRAPD